MDWKRIWENPMGNSCKNHYQSIRRFEEGEGNFKGTLGATLVEYKNNIVKVGSGYQIEERNRIWANKDKLIGRIMEVQYYEESINSKTGLTSLRFPVFKDIREIGKEVSYE